MQKKLHGLYAITNEQLMPEDIFLSKAEVALAYGARILQYRDKSADAQKRIKQAAALKQLCIKYNAILIINDDIELTKEVDAHGIHIGKDDQTIEDVRVQLGQNKIIGVSCYDQVNLAQTAANHGADYVAFGSFFSSDIKPDAPHANIQLINQFKATHSIPVCCIGGITTQNYQPLLEAGADMLAVISDVFCSDDSVRIRDKCAVYADAYESFVVRP